MSHDYPIGAPPRAGRGARPRSIYASFIEQVVLPANDLLLGTCLAAQLRDIRKTQWYPAVRLAELQAERLRALLGHAVRHVPFYRDVEFDPHGDPRRELQKFPIMRKRVIKEHLDRLVVGKREALIESMSSGSSGVQGSVYYNKRELSAERAIQLLWWEWAGYRLGSRTLQTGMTTDRGWIKSAKDLLFRTDYFPAYHLEPGEILEKLNEIRSQKRRPRHLMGYASSLYLFARTARDHAIGDIRFDSVVSWGDKLFPHYRSLIEAQFQTRVHDTYGSTEGCMIAAQCESAGFHVMTPHVYVEVLDSGGAEVPSGELGSVVVTRLDNYSMPLIRYDMGDLAGLEPPEKTCACGRDLPLLQQVIGRDTDIVKTRSGKRMIVHFFTGVFEHFSEVQQFRVVQRTLDEIEIEYIPGNGFSSEIADRIRERIRSYLREDFAIRFVPVDAIPPTASGKPQIVVSLLGSDTGGEVSV